MKIFKDKLVLYNEISGIGNLCFVPTMGGLHNGHKSLIEKAKRFSKKVIVSIYINPKQFNSKSDFKKYPKIKNKDLLLLKKLKVNYLYLPDYNDIFLFKVKNKIYKDKISKKLCGKFRKKHFIGVLNVVNRFLEIIKPKYIFLGKKDFQQLFLIKKHIKKRKIGTKVIPCKTIREKNGIACSSRNINLSKNEKLIASKIYHFLKKEKKLIKNKKILKLRTGIIKKEILKYGVKKIDYIEYLDTINLQKIKKPNVKFNIFIAYHLGNIRLIDNI